MRINRTVLVASRLDFHAFRAGLNGVFRIKTSNDKIGMTIEEIILCKTSGMIGKTGGEQIRDDS